MKEISEEKINRIDDFVFHMSDNEVKEWYVDFKKRQYNLCGYFEFGYKVFPNDEAKEICKRMFILIIKCFETYGVDIPLIKLVELKRWIVDFQKVTNKITSEEIYGIKLYQVGEDIGQLPLAKFIIDKIIFDEKLVPVFTERYLGAFVAVLMTYVWGITGKMQKVVGNRVGDDIPDDFPVISNENINLAMANYENIKKEELHDYLLNLTKIRSDLTDYCSELKAPDLNNPLITKYFYLYAVIYKSYELQYGILPLMLSDVVNAAIKKPIDEIKMDLRNNTIEKLLFQLRKKSKQTHLINFVYNQIKEDENKLFDTKKFESIQMGLYGIMNVLDFVSRKKFNSFARIENPYHVLITKETIDKVDNELLFLNETEKEIYFDKVFKSQKNIFGLAGDWTNKNKSYLVLGSVMTNLTSFFIHCYEYQLGPRSEISFDTIEYYCKEWSKILVDYTGNGDKDAKEDLFYNKIKQPFLIDYANEILNGIKESYKISDDSVFFNCKFFVLIILDIINNQPGILMKENIN